MQLQESLVKPQPVRKAGSTLIIAPNQAFLRALQAAQSFRRLKLLYDCVPLQSCGDTALLGPLLGAPAAVACTEGLLSSGIRRVVLTGFIGGLRNAAVPLAAGDLLFPRGAFSEDGTSKLYGGSERDQSPPGELQLGLEALLKARLGELPAHVGAFEGPIWTTDAPFRETEAKVEQHLAEGVLGVDMEYAAVLRLCHMYEAELAAVFVISDLVGGAWEKRFSSAGSSAGLTRLAEILCAFATRCNER